VLVVRVQHQALQELQSPTRAAAEAVRMTGLVLAVQAALEVVVRVELIVLALTELLAWAAAAAAVA
jgi:hypothetical protein